MPLKRVTKYAAAYNLKAKEYNFYYELDGQAGEMKVTTLNSADDCVALCDLFRNESPIYYWYYWAEQDKQDEQDEEKRREKQEKQEYFITGHEAAGERESGNALAEGPPELRS